jgi:hypothetical protein
MMLAAGGLGHGEIESMDALFIGHSIEMDHAVKLRSPHA